MPIQLVSNVSTATANAALCAALSNLDPFQLYWQSSPFQLYWQSSQRGTREYMDPGFNTLHHVRLHNVLSALD